MNNLVKKIILNKDRNRFTLLLYKILKNSSNIFYKFIPSKIYLKTLYRHTFNKELNLKNPQTLNEKIQWKKIYDRRPVYTLCADKYEVRNYVKERIGEKYLIPLLFYTNNPNKIDFDKIPLPFIIKANHGSGWIFIIKNKKEINKKEIIERCKKWLESNIYFIGREWQYKNIKPKILIEKLLLDEEGQIPKDYKFHCFNGEVEFIQVDTDRFENHKRGFFDINWRLLPFTWSPKKNNRPKYELNKDINKPKKLREMVEIATTLSKNFDYVRVDLYFVNNKIYFGELTFSHEDGFAPFFPEKYDLIYEKKLKLKR